ncbi:MAG: CHAT domain-containing protein [Anaerolineae bacterium]|nr:CHAT domain-containing protein [Anaerolineae bacterium]
MQPSYHDFILIVDGTPGAYTVAAEGPGEIRVAPTAFRWEEAGAVRSALMAVQAGQPPAREEMEALGSALFVALFPRPVIRAFERAPDALPSDHLLRLKLVVRPPELSHLPWELLYDPDEQRFLAPRLSCPIVRFVESGQPAASLLAPRPLRVLYVQANPPGTVPLDLEASERALRDGLGEAGVVRAVRATTPAALRDVLREQPGYHVLHYDGHGLFHRDRGEGYLFLHDEDGQAHRLSGEVLATYLDGTAVRLVVLSACLTAAESRAKSFSGLAQQLIRAANLPAVVAMQFAIPDASAIAFTREFYRAIADDYPVDAATVEGRKAVLERLGSDALAFTAPDWATPVLLMRSPDGDIFRAEAPASPPPDSTEQERRLEAAMPHQAQVDRQTEVRAMISLPDSPGLRAHLPDWTEAGDEIVKDDVRQYRVPVEFPVDPLTGRAAAVDLYLVVSATGFDVEPSKRVRVSPGFDSGVVTFFLTPRQRQDRARVRVELFADEALDRLIGSLTLMIDVLGRRDELAQNVWRWATTLFATAQLRPAPSPAISVQQSISEVAGGTVVGASIGDLIGTTIGGGEALPLPKGWWESLATPYPQPLDPAGYNLQAVRELLLAAFTAQDFHRLFLYTADDRLRPLIHEFSPADGLADMVDEAIGFCMTRRLLPALLAAVERERPGQYAAFAPRLIAAGGSPQAGAADVTLDALLALFEQGDRQPVARGTISDLVLVLGPEAMEALARLVAERAGVDRQVVREAGTEPQEDVVRQIDEVVAAQKEVAARGGELSAPAAYHLGLLAAYRRDYEQALDYFRRAGELDPDFSDAFEWVAWIEQILAIAARQRQAYDEARNRLDAAREAAEHADPLDLNTLALRGYIAKMLAELAEIRNDSPERERMYLEAARFFDHVVRLDPDHASAHNGLGNVLYARGEIDRAIDAYRRAVELQPTYAAAHHDLAAAYQAKMAQDPPNAASWCRQALAEWRQVYELAPLDLTFSADDLLIIGQRIAWLRQQCP